MLTRTGLKCDCCGRFISTDDLAEGRAIHKLLKPDTPFTRETWDSYHVRCDEVARNSDKDWERILTGKEWEQMPADRRPMFWTTPTASGPRFRVAQLIFKTNEDAINYVKQNMPSRLKEASRAWWQSA